MVSFQIQRHTVVFNYGKDMDWLKKKKKVPQFILNVHIYVTFSELQNV